MQPLTNLDASWLLGETAQTPFHIANLLVFTKPDASQPAPFAQFRAHLESKLHDLPLMHRHLDATSLKLGNPVWIDDPEVDFDYHIKLMSIPDPGTKDQLNALVARIHEPLLDRSKPLWQAVMIDGLEGGKFAIYLKMHHAAVDGGAVNGVLNVMFEDPANAKPPSNKTVQKSRAPTPVELMWNTTMNYYVNAPRKVMESVGAIVKAATPNEKDKEKAKFDMSDIKDMMVQAPKTIFNASVGAGRTFGTAHLPLSEIKAFGKAHGATVNDVVLLLCSGALRKYLEKRKQLPSQPLVVGMPVSLRAEGDMTPTNQIFIMFTSLPTNVGEVAPRIPAIRKSVASAKKLNDALRPLADLAVAMPSLRLPYFTNLSSMMEAIKLGEDMGMTGKTNPVVNLWLSNIPGPRTPLYCAGIPAQTNIPVGLPMHGIGLNITAISYLDSMDFGVIGCSKLVPDAQELANMLAAEFQAAKDALG